MTLDQLKPGTWGRLVTISGPRPFRRRLLEMGLVPGTRLMMQRGATVGQPLRVMVRGGTLSIRRREAASIEIEQEGGR